jgi:hypothetical protein
MWPTSCLDSAVGSTCTAGEGAAPQLTAPRVAATVSRKDYLFITRFLIFFLKISKKIVFISLPCTASSLQPELREAWSKHKLYGVRLVSSDRRGE